MEQPSQSVLALEDAVGREGGIGSARCAACTAAVGLQGCGSVTVGVACLVCARTCIDDN